MVRNLIEQSLALDVTPASWPIGMGHDFLGTYDLFADALLLFERGVRDPVTKPVHCNGLDDPELARGLPKAALAKLREEVEMALGLCPACDPQAYHAGHLTLNVNSRVEANRREIRQQASPGPIWINKRNPSALSRGIHMAHSRYLAGLDALKRAELEHRLFARQSGRCFICDKPIDLILHKGQLDIDHIDPLIEEGLDAENNFAITHASCNRSKGAANLEIARRLAEFQSLQ